MTLQELISKKFPNITEGWDKWNYELCCPVSLDDEAKLYLYLTYEDGRADKIIMKITDLELV